MMLGMNRPLEDLRFAVEEWSADNSGPIEIIARVGVLTVAMSAYWSAAAARPKARIILREKARELAHRPPPK